MNCEFLNIYSLPRRRLFGAVVARKLAGVPPRRATSFRRFAYNWGLLNSFENTIDCLWYSALCPVARRLPGVLLLELAPRPPLLAQVVSRLQWIFDYFLL